MRGVDVRRDGLFSYVRGESRIRSDHPLRDISKLVEEALSSLLAGRIDDATTSARPDQVGRAATTRDHDRAAARRRQRLVIRSPARGNAKPALGKLNDLAGPVRGGRRGGKQRMRAVPRCRLCEGDCRHHCNGQRCCETNSEHRVFFQKM